METILITGGTGFLGSSLVRRLARRDCRLILLVRNREMLEGGGLEQLLAEEDGRAPAPSAVIEHVKGDITRDRFGLDGSEYLRLADEVNTVFHCAALTDFSNRDALVDTNVEGTRRVLDFSITHGLKRYHHISSAYVVGKRVADEHNDNGNDCMHGAGGFNNAYEETKFIGESLVKEYISRFKLPATVYRPSIIMGNSRTGHTKCFKGIYTFARALYLISRYAPDASFRIFGEREAIINLVPIDYVADSILAIAGDDKNVNKTLNITNPNPPTLSQLNVKLAQAIGIKPPEIVPLSERYTLSSPERLYLSYTRPYLPYVHSNIRFDCSSSQEFLAKTNIACPRVTRKLISLLLDFAIRNHWGSKVMPSEPALAGAN